MYFAGFIGNKEEIRKAHKLSLLCTDVKEENSITHFLHADYEVFNQGFALRFTVLSFNLVSKESWGPYIPFRLMPTSESYEVSDWLHIHGYCYQILGLKHGDSLAGKTHMTQFIQGMPYKEWLIVWNLLNEMREKRTRNRIDNPRNIRSDKFEDDIFDKALARIINRVNAILNEQLFWGLPERDKEGKTTIYILPFEVERR